MVSTRANGAGDELGHVHVPIWAEGLADIAVQRIDDDAFTAVTQPRVPRCRFVKERAPVVVFDVS